MSDTKTLEQNNHEFCNETLELKHSLELHYLEMGRRLLEIRDGQLYKPYWDSFTEFLMELKWSDSSRANRIINIYKKFVQEYNIEPKKLAAAGGWSVLAEVLPVATDKESAEEWIEKAALHPQKELRAEIRDARGIRTIKKDSMSNVQGNIRIVRDHGLWNGSVVTGQEYDQLEHQMYGPCDTLEELLHKIKVGPQD